ncbi:MAG TPA: glycosyltransferase family 9 protein [Thermoanaerobaculia bacterium]
MTRLLVLRLSALGDVIHTIPAVVALRDAFPRGMISWAVEAPYCELVEIVAGVEAIPVSMKKWGLSPISSRSAIIDTWYSLRRAGVSVDFQGLLKSAMLGWLSGASVRFGLHRDVIREKAALAFLTRPVAVDPRRHVVEQNLELAFNVLHGATPGTPNWNAFPEPTNALRELEGAIVLLPGAGKRNKIWPPERFGELARRIGARAVVAWGPPDRLLAEATGAPLAPPTNLRELAWLLRHARVVVGGDTGPLHLAAALGTKVVGLYGPTNPRRTGPYGQLDRCIERYSTTKLMNSISVEDVMTLLGRVASE